MPNDQDINIGQVPLFLFSCVNILFYSCYSISLHNMYLPLEPRFWEIFFTIAGIFGSSAENCLRQYVDFEIKSFMENINHCSCLQNSNQSKAFVQEAEGEL